MVLVVVWVKLVAEGIKDKKVVQVGIIRLVLRGGKCHCNVACLKGVLIHYLLNLITLKDLDSLCVDSIDLIILKQAGLIPEGIKSVKVISSGNIKRSVLLKGIQVTKGAKREIEAAGGKIE